MKDQLISLEVAKLAKDKGFNETCYSYYENERLHSGPFGSMVTSTLYGKRADIHTVSNSKYELPYFKEKKKCILRHQHNHYFKSG